ncbi:FAD-binding oxidoreductase [Flavobacterium sp. MFBS3-15]|uniref:NAD(P)/FAD-dependent oxidoreductase n=1 Tax=Flavobacterium sp. MFBS3-15 TaxID=2989816 RepID=UPI002236A88F|nr:FAD-dependent oxidoreductase [Flavobacterium sp. MFBS3-15]MCW4469499.1 FAD-binding oxidoreductase [Flavobacterium sp. MFBS3-15]
MKDFIIVGGGIAGISFAETAFRAGKTFTVVSDDSQNSSLVAGGLYNPVILKRLNMPQDAVAHMAFIKPFYKSIEERLKIRFDVHMPIYRKFASVEEQNNWFAAADKPGLDQFLSLNIIHKNYPCLPSPYGFGEVMHTGYLDTAALVSGYHNFLRQSDSLIEEKFNHDALVLHDDYLEYKGVMATNIIFAEGFGIKKNPFFTNLPLNGTKGEMLIIEAPGLELDVIIKADVFILPLGNTLFKVGATYEWEDKTNIPTEAARTELCSRLEEIITCDYQVVNQLAGIRPTTKDRKPLLGTHPNHKNVHLLNGLGTRGVMLGPPMAKELFDSIISGNPVRKEVNLERFM